MWSPLLNSEQWFAGEDGVPSFISLKPEDMEILSEAQPPAPSKKENKQEAPIQFEGDIPLQSSLAFLSGGRQKQEMVRTVII